MVKRILALMLSLLLLVCALPLNASAATTATTPTEIRKQIKRMYNRTLYATGLDSLSGYCGTMTGYQLYYLGVDSIPQPHNGKDGYDLYKNREFSTGGHRIRTYPATQYTLEEALYSMSKGGTEDVYNIFVGFQRTTTEAGAIYGHSLVIQAILDGNVYFGESYRHHAFGPAGNGACLSIPEFVRYYTGWCTFEGAVLFGMKTDLDLCKTYPASQFVQLTEDTVILETISDDLTQVKTLRTAKAGERIAVDTIYEDLQGRFFYRISSSEGVGYMAADTSVPVQPRYEDISLQTVNVPQELKKGQNFGAKLTAVSVSNAIESVKIAIRNDQGEQVLTYEEAGAGCMVKLSKSLQTKTLPEGCYTYEISAAVVNYYMAEDVLSAQYDTVLLQSSRFTVGNAELTAEVRETVSGEPEVIDGWFYADGTWYCYDEGEPRSGWYYDGGIDYYLQEDGSVTKGWSMINGKGRFFSDTGAMRIGWLENDHDTYYMLSNGVAARGWHTIDGDKYYFQENGWLLKGTWLEQEDGKYYLLADGKAATGWNKLPDGNYFFAADGKAVSQMFEENGISYIRLFRDGAEDLVFSALQANG